MFATLMEVLGYATGIALLVWFCHIIFYLPISIRKSDTKFLARYYKRTGNGPPGLKWSKCPKCDGVGELWRRPRADGLGLEDVIIPKNMRQAKNDTPYFQPPLANHVECHACSGLGGRWIKRRGAT